MISFRKKAMLWTWIFILFYNILEVVIICVNTCDVGTRNRTKPVGDSWSSFWVIYNWFCGVGFPPLESWWFLFPVPAIMLARQISARSYSMDRRRCATTWIGAQVHARDCSIWHSRRQPSWLFGRIVIWLEPKPNPVRITTCMDGIRLTRSWSRFEP